MGEFGFDDDAGSAERAPSEDERVWRHPSEIGSLIGATDMLGGNGGGGGNGFVMGMSGALAPERRSWGLAAGSAIGAALLVTAAFMALGQLDPDLIVVRERLAVQPVTTVPEVVSPDDWAATVAERVEPAVARLTVRTADGIETGSGVLLRDDGYLVTARSVIAGAESVAITLDDGTPLPGTVIGADYVSGLAVVRVESSDLPTAVQAPSTTMTTGQDVVVVGHRSTEERLLSGSIMSTENTLVDRLARHHHDLALIDQRPGAEHAGAAVVDNTGALIGIALPVDGHLGGTAVLPMDIVRSVTADIMSTGVVEHDGWLGAELETVSAPAGSGPTIGLGSGARVDGLIFNSPGHRAGLRAEDLIVAINRSPVTSLQALEQAIAGFGPNHAATLTVVRDGELITVEAVLGRRPAR